MCGFDDTVWGDVPAPLRKKLYDAGFGDDCHIVFGSLPSWLRYFPDGTRVFDQIFVVRENTAFLYRVGVGVDSGILSVVATSPLGDLVVKSEKFKGRQLLLLFPGNKKVVFDGKRNVATVRRLTGALTQV